MLWHRLAVASLVCCSLMLGGSSAGKPAEQPVSRLSSLISRPQEQRRPNVLLIMPDQMRGQALGVAGNPDVRTPVLDRLAAEGIYLPNTFANTPVCCPARATLLTGMYPHGHGVIINDLRMREEIVTVPEILAAEGYRTGFIGKWHLDGGIRHPGFVPPGERRQGFQFWAANECSHQHFENWYFRDDPIQIPIAGFEVETWTDLAIEFIESCGDQPFYLEIAMGPPHNPYQAPDEYAAMYDPESLTMRPNWRPNVRFGSREDIAHYYGMITCIDDHVGRLLAALEELGIAEDTIVLFTSDHGDMLGSQGAFFKRMPWEESIRVPGIVRYPRGLPAGVTNQVLFSHVDIPPTLLGLCGVDVPEQMQGRDLSEALASGTGVPPVEREHRDCGTGVPPVERERGDCGTGVPPVAVLLSNYEPYAEAAMYPWRAVRTARHLYAREADGPWLLYDLENDPYQLENLVDRPEYAELQHQLDDLLAREMQRAGDSWEHNLDREYQLLNQPAVYAVDELDGE